MQEIFYLDKENRGITDMSHSEYSETNVSFDNSHAEV